MPANSRLRLIPILASVFLRGSFSNSSPPICAIIRSNLLGNHLPGPAVRCFQIVEDEFHALS